STPETEQPVWALGLLHHTHTKITPTQTHTHTYTHRHTNTHTDAQLPTHAYTHTHTQTHTHTHTQSPYVSRHSSSYPSAQSPVSSRCMAWGSMSAESGNLSDIRSCSWKGTPSSSHLVKPEEND